MLINFSRNRHSKLIFLHNVVDTKNLIAAGHKISLDDISALSPYITKHIKRFGDYYLNINAIPSPILREILSMLAIQMYMEILTSQLPIFNRISARPHLQ